VSNTRNPSRNPLVRHRAEFVASTYNIRRQPRHSPRAVGTEALLTYSDQCVHQPTGKKCRQSQCKYVHEDQVARYDNVIAQLKWANKVEEAAATQNEGMEM
jgi:hypothetical protein